MPPTLQNLLGPLVPIGIADIPKVIRPEQMALVLLTITNGGNKHREELKEAISKLRLTSRWLPLTKAELVPGTLSILIFVTNALCGTISRMVPLPLVAIAKRKIARLLTSTVVELI